LIAELYWKGRFAHLVAKLDSLGKVLFDLSSSLLITDAGVLMYRSR
jgi:hypothetical protein